MVLLFIFLSVTSLQILFWLSFLFVRRDHGGNHSKEQEIEATSIVVCTRNEIENLKELVPLLFQQDHPKLQVVIVDDRSTDGTYEYLSGYRNNHRLKVVRVDNIPDHIHAKKYGLTLGIKAASHDIILLTDADCRPVSNRWASLMASSYTPETTFVLGYSPYQYRGGIVNMFIRYETLVSGLSYLSSAVLGNPYMGVGRNLSYRRSFFLKQHGFKGFQHLVGGDDDLLVNKFAIRLNTAICVEPESMVLSIPKSNWKDLFIQKKRHFSVGKHYKKWDQIRLSLFSISQLLFWICLLTLSLLTLNPYLIIGGFVSRLLTQIVVIRLSKKFLSGKFPIYLLPLVDLIYSTFHPLVSVVALLSKQIRWR